MKTRILALDLAKWLQTLWLHSLVLPNLTLFHTLNSANKYLKVDKSVSLLDVRSAWSGIRPLVYDVSGSGKNNNGDGTDDDNDTKSISRTHVIEVSKNGLVTIAGGKWTTYRRMAQDVVDKIIDFPDIKRRVKRRLCQTEGRGIIGADRAGVISGGKFDRVVVTLREDYGLSRDVAEHLVSNYGTRALQIGEMVYPKSSFFEPKVYHRNFGARKLSKKFPFLEAEVVFAVRQEYALSAVDVLARRTRLLYLDADAAQDCVQRVVDLMGVELGWSWRRKANEIAAAEKFISTFRATCEPE